MPQMKIGASPSPPARGWAGAGKVAISLSTNRSCAARSYFAPLAVALAAFASRKAAKAAVEGVAEGEGELRLLLGRG
jgi:hypothetical protein